MVFKIIFFIVITLQLNGNLNRAINATKLNNIFYYYNIPHLELNDNSMIIESALKDLMSMNGVQYVYKRDFYWRTWRRIKNGTKEELIHYKSQSISEINCTICHSGFWEIEDKTELCRFEISAMNNREELTVFRPENSKIQYSLTILNLIRKCGNPIKTKMRIAYKYDSKWPVFCQGREFCEIDTVYIIHPDFVLFQIINSTNIIIYSKIMMAGNRNFVCLDNCQKRSPTENKKVEIKQDLTVTSTFNTSDIKKKYHRSVFKNTIYNRNKDNDLPTFSNKLSKLSPCKKLELMEIMKENEEFHPFL